MTSQDLVKRINLTGLTNVGGTEMNQLIDAGTVAADKGLVITTTDAALDTPEVPNPDATLEGITPQYWRRYIWLRKPFTEAGINKIYTWNDFTTSDATYLKWSIVVDTAELLLAISLAEQDAAEALTEAQAAVTTATTYWVPLHRLPSPTD